MAVRHLLDCQARGGSVHPHLHVRRDLVDQRIPDPHSFAFLYVGNAFFIFVGSTLFGTFQVIQSDREWYQTLRYVYISPISYYVYILGRAFSKILVSIFGVLITLGFGFFFLHVDMRFTPDRIPLFIVSLAL